MKTWSFTQDKYNIPLARMMTRQMTHWVVSGSKSSVSDLANHDPFTEEDSKPPEKKTFCLTMSNMLKFQSMACNIVYFEEPMFFALDPSVTGNMRRASARRAMFKISYTVVSAILAATLGFLVDSYLYLVSPFLFYHRFRVQGKLSIVHLSTIHLILAAH